MCSLTRGTRSGRYLINHPSVDHAQRIDLSRLLELARWLDPQISTDAEHSTRVSRVLAIADAYDAMLADRPYRNAMTVQQASKELEAGAGTQFDPILVEAFLRRGIGHSAQLRPQRTGAPLSLAA